MPVWSSAAMLISPCSVRPSRPHWKGASAAARRSHANPHTWHEKKKKKKATICHQKSLSIFFFSQRELFPFPRRARGLIQTYSSAYLLLRLPLLSPPISSRANSELICNSRRRRNWCLILALGNRIMWVMREGRKKERKREGERQEKKRQTFWYEESFALSWLFLFFFHAEGGNPS